MGSLVYNNWHVFLKCLLEQFFVCLRVLKNTLNDAIVIWSSAGRFSCSRSRPLAVSYLEIRKPIFVPQLICLFIVGKDGKF